MFVSLLCLSWATTNTLLELQDQLTTVLVGLTQSQWTKVYFAAGAVTSWAGAQP
jgi:hypothetical protein